MKNFLRFVGILLVAAGIWALVSGGFTYTKKKKDLSIGKVGIELKKEEKIEIPTAAGVAMVVGGAILAAWGGGRRAG
ncbi:MAG TPA: hypothetical protein VF017_23530 [Thermoanaerobaculia bacterium]|nr:hypothetical protein [Thermoanaerobaculia bacterium]